MTGSVGLVDSLQHRVVENGVALGAAIEFD